MNDNDLESLNDLLVALCLYNEVGHVMRQDRAADMTKVRAGFRQAIDLFVERVGEHNMPAEVLRELRSAFVLEDGEGVVLRRLEPFLKIGPVLPA